MKATVFMLIAAAAALTGCAAPEAEKPRPLKPLKCIAVMPVETGADDDGMPALQQAQDLEKGARIATGQMAKLLTGNRRAHLISEDGVEALSPVVVGGSSGVIAAIGEQTGCDGVLSTTLERFRRREGGEYSVNAPASAAFTMALFHAPTGEVLWTADFNETQQSYLSNIFSNRMGQHGFRWITVEELLSQGIGERLGACPYLNE